MGVDFSTLSKIELGKVSASHDLVTRAELVLKTGGRLIDAHRREVGLPRPRELPPAPALLVGRERQLAQLDIAIEDRAEDTLPLIVIDGPAGVGKTALAMKWAHRAARLFPDGQLYADLRGFSPDRQPEDPSRVLLGFCRSLGVTEIPDELAGRAALFRSVVSGARVLIVLDNVANAEQIKMLLPGTANCAVVVTSRSVLFGLILSYDGRRVSVEPLSEPDSVALFGDIVGNDRVAAEPDAVKAIARQCGHIPLAMRIAAELAVAHPRRPLADLALDLANEDDRLEFLEIDDVNTPRTAISWTYRKLSESAARVFRFLGLDPKLQLTPPAIAALVNISARETRVALRQLAGVHLLENVLPGATPEVGCINDLLRAYAREALIETETSAARSDAAQRLISWYLHATRAAGGAIAPCAIDEREVPEPPAQFQPLNFSNASAALTWFDLERDNLTPITRLAAEYGQPGAACDLTLNLWDYFMIRRPWSVWRDTHLIAIETARATHDDDVQARLSARWAEALRQQGHLEEAQHLYDQALELQRHSGQPWILIGAARVSLDQERHHRAHALAKRAEALFGDDFEGLAVAHTIIAAALDAEGNIGASLARVYRAIDMLELGADRYSKAQDAASEARLRGRAEVLRIQLQHPAGPLTAWMRDCDAYKSLRDSFELVQIDHR